MMTRRHKSDAGYPQARQWISADAADNAGDAEAPATPLSRGSSGRIVLATTAVDAG